MRRDVEQRLRIEHNCVRISRMKRGLGRGANGRLLEKLPARNHVCYETMFYEIMSYEIIRSIGLHCLS